MSRAARQTAPTHHCQRDLAGVGSAIALAVLALSCAGTTSTPDAAGFFSVRQAERGRASYIRACRECHSLSDFRGADFEWKWRRRTAWDFYTHVATTMPENRPGALAPDVYADIVAYVLSLNDYQAGGTDLPAAREALAEIQLGADAARTRTKE